MGTVLVAQAEVWKGYSEGLDLQRRATVAPDPALLAKLAQLRSSHILCSPRPEHVDSSIAELEKAKETLERLVTACKGGNIEEIMTNFYTLSKDHQNFLLWGIWIRDSLEAKPIVGLRHGLTRLLADPTIIASNEAKKVIYMNGDSLAEQLFHRVNDWFAIKYQEIRASGLPVTHEEQAKLGKMQAAWDLGQYDQMIALKPLFRTDEQRMSFEKHLSPRARSWLLEPSMLVVCGAGAVAPAPVVRAAAGSKELYETRGAHYKEGITSFSVYAPGAHKVECVLTSYGKVEHVLPMAKQADGTWTVSTKLAAVGRTYLYRVTDCHGKVLDRVDPFSFGSVHVSETDTLHSVVVDRDNFAWTDGAWNDARAKSAPLERPLSIYELHIKSWDPERKMNLREIAPKLAAYCKEIGFTHVELYGIMEHFWGGGRGYQVSNFFAPYHQSGNYDDMKYFVNYMHEQGLGVIADWIPAHYDHGGHNARHSSASMHNFDGTNLFSAGASCWGTHFVDYSRLEARRLMEASAMWWLKEFHFDALRVDAVSQLVRRDGKDIPAGIDFLAKLNDKIHRECPGVFMVAEATDWDPRVTQPSSKGGFGFDLNWSVGASHGMRNYLRTPDRERSKDEHHRGKLERIFSEGQRAYERKISTHSHDDMDGGASHDKTLYHLGKDHSDETGRMSDLRNFFAWQIFGPNWGHLIHMGDEMALPESWYARICKKQSGVQWEVADRAAHKAMKAFVKDAIHYYKGSEGFWKRGGSDAEMMYSYAPNKVMAYARGRNIVIHNFSKIGYDSYDIDIPASGRFSRIASAVERLNSDAAKYGGSGRYLNERVNILHGGDGRATKLQVRLPPQAVLVLEIL